MLEHSIWAEKYRPINLDTYIGNEHVKAKVKIFLDSKDIPHLLFYGSAGTGKTTLAKIIAKNIDCDCLYVNASDENSVDVVRTKIKSFASTVGFKDLKIVILDEFDFFSPNAQAALRNLMETFSKTTRFILTANYMERIIEPIQSRCQNFNIIPPSKKDIAVHVANILNIENVSYEKEDLAIIINANYPDIRKIIGTCQNYSVPNENGQLKLTVDTQSLIESNYMLKLLEILKSGGSKQKLFIEIRQLLADSRLQQFDSLFRFLYDNVGKLNADLSKQAQIILLIAEAQYNDAFVVDKEINAMSMFTKIIQEI